MRNPTNLGPVVLGHPVDVNDSPDSRVVSELPGDIAFDRPEYHRPIDFGESGPKRVDIRSIVGDIRDSVIIEHGLQPGTLGEYIAVKSPGGVDQASLDLAKNLAAIGKPAQSFLEKAADTMKARAQLRDQPAGERSMARTVAIFNAWTGNNLSVEDGWRFMISLKQAREIQGFYNEDDYIDLVSYSSLLGEEESGNVKRKNFKDTK